MRARIWGGALPRMCCLTFTKLISFLAPQFTSLYNIGFLKEMQLVHVWHCGGCPEGHKKVRKYLVFPGVTILAQGHEEVGLENWV